METLFQRIAAARSAHGAPAVQPIPGRRSFFAATALCLASLGLGVSTPGIARDNAIQGTPIESWAGTWTASPQAPAPGVAVPQFSNQSVRQIIHTSIAGAKVRVKFSNEFGTRPLVIGAAHIAQQQSGSTVLPGSDRVLTFGGRPGATIPAGAPLLSDPVNLAVAANSNLAVSLYLPQPTEDRTVHALGLQTNFITSGDTTGAVTLNAPTTSTAWHFLTAVTVESQARVIAVLGDAITDGFASTPGANRRWPDLLSARLQARGGNNRLSVINQGIGGNRLTFDNTGPNALARYSRDVLSQPGLEYVIVLEGIGDIGQPGPFAPVSEAVSADDIIAAHRQLIARAHSKGVRIIGATLTPFEGTTLPGYFTPAGEAKRQQVNNFIRTSREYDGVIDFDAALRDPANPSRMRPAFDSGDHLHPGDAGYQAMANAVDLSLFDIDLSLLRREASELRNTISGAIR